MDFEKINLIFIDLIEKLNKDLTHTAENSLSNELLKTIFSKVDKIETTQNNMNQNISTILNSVSSIHTIFSEQKNTYIQEIRNSLESIIDNKQLSYNEKIQHILEKNQTAAAVAES